MSAQSGSPTPAALSRAREIMAQEEEIIRKLHRRGMTHERRPMTLERALKKAKMEEKLINMEAPGSKGPVVFYPPFDFVLELAAEENNMEAVVFPIVMEEPAKKSGS